MEYKLYKHKIESNSWLVVRKPEDLKSGYQYVYDVEHLEPAGTRYEDIEESARLRSGI